MKGMEKTTINKPILLISYKLCIWKWADSCCPCYTVGSRHKGQSNTLIYTLSYREIVYVYMLQCGNFGKQMHSRWLHISLMKITLSQQHHFDDNLFLIQNLAFDQQISIKFQ